MKTKLEKNFEEIFDLPEGEPLAKVEKIEPPSNENPDIESDYKYARENLYNVIERGSDALDNLVAIAQASEHPRAYEVVGSLIKTLTDANKDLLEIQSKVKKLKEETKKGPDNVTNALFIGSTAELQKMIKSDS
jgi:DNA-binding ferritin-like protein